jgi:ATP synthase protein I
MNQQKPKSPYNSYAKYSSMGLQMGVIIFVGVFGGFKLDELLNLKFPVFTVVLSLLSVFASIYFVTKDLNKKTRE